MPNLGFPEIMIILVVALLVFGPKKLPDLGRSLGNGIREFRKGTQGLKDELAGSMKDAPAAQPTVATPQAVQPPVLSAAQATPTAVILPSAPVVHVIELGKPATHEEAPKV
ncbi:twin-arginine translocase TatA/TatE family subunit [Deinococcus radiomollis]|uniref:Sec-independent protein translocase subunit TatA/TatB n=1 Tax=Deinococcus radiomollis TaxID=468916 RepID=UPI0038919E65